MLFRTSLLVVVVVVAMRRADGSSESRLPDLADYGDDFTTNAELYSAIATVTARFDALAASFAPLEAELSRMRTELTALRAADVTASQRSLPSVATDASSADNDVPAAPTAVDDVTLAKQPSSTVDWMSSALLQVTERQWATNATLRRIRERQERLDADLDAIRRAQEDADSRLLRVDIVINEATELWARTTAAVDDLLLQKTTLSTTTAAHSRVTNATEMPTEAKHTTAFDAPSSGGSDQAAVVGNATLLPKLQADADRHERHLSALEQRVAKSVAVCDDGFRDVGGRVKRMRIELLSRFERFEERLLETEMNFANTSADTRNRVEWLQGKHLGELFAFSARVGAGVPLSNDGTFVFNEPTIGQVDSYDTVSGYFTAPVNGRYFFYVALVCANGAPNVAEMLLRGDVRVASIHLSSVGSRTAGNAGALVSMRKGHDIRIRLVDPTVSCDPFTSSFTGYLLPLI